MSHCVCVGTPNSVAVDEVNCFVYFGHGNGSITQVTFDGSSRKHILSGKLNLYDCSRVVILHTILCRYMIPVAY